MIFGYIALYPPISEYLFERSLPKYPTAEMVYRDEGYYGAGSIENVLYYWTSDTLSDIQTYYNTMQFATYTNDSGEWSQALVESSMQQSHSRQCTYLQRYDCAIIYLVDMQQSDWYRIDSVAPCCFRLQEPLPVEIPDHGTLIIFAYFGTDFR